MKKENIDKLKEAIEDGLKVFEDIKEAKESDDKITLLEGGTLVVKHGGKAIRLFSSIQEIGDEIADLDGEEAQELSQLFGGSTEAKEAIGDIAKGSGYLNQGIQKLIALRKQ